MKKQLVLILAILSLQAPVFALDDPPVDLQEDLAHLWDMPGQLDAIASQIERGSRDGGDIYGGLVKRERWIDQFKKRLIEDILPAYGLDYQDVSQEDADMAMSFIPTRVANLVDPTRPKLIVAMYIVQKVEVTILSLVRALSIFA